MASVGRWSVVQVVEVMEEYQNNIGEETEEGAAGAADPLNMKEVPDRARTPRQRARADHSQRLCSGGEAGRRGGGAAGRGSGPLGRAAALQTSESVVWAPMVWSTWWSTWGSGFGFRVQALRRGHALPTPPPFPPVLTGHASSLPPY